MIKFIVVVEFASVCFVLNNIFVCYNVLKLICDVFLKYLPQYV